ncbi:MAG: serine hydrolase [Parvularculaceae bacterium]
MKTGRMIIAAGAAACAAAAIFGAAVAQDAELTLHQKTQIAGHAAQFTCSATFNAGRAFEDIARSELEPVFVTRMLGGVAAAAPEINREARFVAQSYDASMPPRYAVWRPHLGCVALPVGADIAAAAHMPRIDLPDHREDGKALPWPQGDRDAFAPPLPAEARARLDAAVAAAFDRKTYGEGSETTAVVILQGGKIVAERYRDDFDMYTSQRTWSVAKSVAASVIGAAVEQGIVDPRAPSGIPEWGSAADPRRVITLENLLHMSSGLWSLGNRTDFIYFGGGTVTQQAVSHPLEAPPGARWKYANNDTMLAIRALRAAMNDDQRYLEFPFTDLFHKIGMNHTNPETDWQGNFVFSSQVWTTARDLARLGLLYLHNGVWDGERILPEWWAAYVATPAPSQPPRRGDGPARGYGAQFWLLGEFPGVPDDAYAMLGNRGQIVVIVPSRDAVIVRRGYDASGTGVRFSETSFAAAVLEALE